MAGKEESHDIEMEDVSFDDGVEGAEEAFPVGTTVLAKLKGFPAWPAVIVRETDVAPSVRAVRPKKKQVFPVLFYNDHNYMWATASELKYLGPEEAAKAANKPKIKRALKQAFEIAAAPPPVDEYIESISTFPVQDVEEVVEPEKPATPARAKRAADKPVSISRATRSSTKKRPSTDSEKKTKKVKVVSNENGVDGDVSMDADSSFAPENDDDENLSTDRIELRGPKPRGRPSSKKEKVSPPATLDDVTRSSELRTELCKQVRFKFQKALLGDEPIQSAQFTQLRAYLDQVAEVPNLEISIVRATKLNHVLKAILKLPELREADEKFASVVEKQLEKWSTPTEPIIRGRPEDEVGDDELLEASVEPEYKEETEEPYDNENAQSYDQHEAENEVKEESVQPEQSANGSGDANKEQTNGPSEDQTEEAKPSEPVDQ